MRAAILVSVIAFGFGVSTSAQEFPPPTGPVVFCGQQSLPEATSYQVIFNSGAPEALSMDGTTDSGCPTGMTHSFRLPANLFTVGTHTVQVRAINAFGATDGPVYTVTVGIAPGPFTILSVVPPSAE